MANSPQKKNISIQEVLTSLLDTQTFFPPAYHRQFSDLDGVDLEALRSIWLQITPSRRVSLLEDLETLQDLDTLVSFVDVGRMALPDPEPRVRVLAIRLLWEALDAKLIPIFLKMLKSDKDVNVRATAASVLAVYIYEGEVEEIPEVTLHQIEKGLLQAIHSNDDELVRRHALEALGFSSRPELPPLIEKAYQSDQTEWVASALYAMGRSANEVWIPKVLRMLNSPDARIQLEAVRAAGELSAENARRALLDILDEEAQDSDIRTAVIWSLSQIGGEQVRETLEGLVENNEDEEEVEILNDALDNLSFTEDTALYGLLDMDDLGMNQENMRETFLDQDDAEYEHGKEEVESSPEKKAPGRKRHKPHTNS